MKFRGWEFKEAARQVDAVVGRINPSEAKAEWTPAMKQKAMDRLWRTSTAVHPRDPVGRYLINRIGITTFPDTLRTALGVKHREGGTHPCMLAMLTGPDGKACMIHRTYLTDDGHKAAVEKQKMFMPGNIPDGAAVRLGPVCDTIVLAEGIESALSVTKLFGVTCWATCSTGIMQKWRPPEGVKKVIIFGDLDLNFAGKAAAYTLAHRICDVVEVGLRFPPEVGIDFNDVLRTA
jgi:putative DNA primase/helicase